VLSVEGVLFGRHTAAERVSIRVQHWSDDATDVGGIRRTTSQISCHYRTPRSAVRRKYFVLDSFDYMERLARKAHNPLRLFRSLSLDGRMGRAS
jgi:hypothetical protein